MERSNAESTVIGFSGFSGSGKTTLIEKLIPLLKGRGLSVAVIKHDAHEFEMDREGKDTYRFTGAGADIVMISSGTKSARLESRPCTLEEMIELAGGADIVLVEGYKHADIPRIGVEGPDSTHMLPDDVNDYIAVACDDPASYEGISGIPVFSRDDAKAVAEWICAYAAGNKGSREAMKEFTHFDDEGNARMVNVSDKDVTRRSATAAARVTVNRETFNLIRTGGIKKGDVLTVAQTAGIMGAKRTPDLIPMCHPLIIDGAGVRLKLNEEECCIDIEAEVRCTGRTGVEMEAICACSVAAMTVYDMCKSVQRDIVISEIKLMSKTGGVHGDYVRDPKERKRG